MIGTREQHEAARADLLEREKEHMRQGDELARQRRELPWVPVEQDYVFQTTAGERTLADLFEGRSQLLVYHFMFTPEDEAGCVGCSFLSDHLDGPEPHVNARDITLKVVSRGNLDDLQAYRERMGWQFDWVSSEGTSFNRDLGATTDARRAAGLQPVRARGRGRAPHLLELGPRLRDHRRRLPPDRPVAQGAPGGGRPAGSWWRRHDEYERAPVA